MPEAPGQNPAPFLPPIIQPGAPGGIPITPIQYTPGGEGGCYSGDTGEGGCGQAGGAEGGGEPEETPSGMDLEFNPFDYQSPNLPWDTYPLVPERPALPEISRAPTVGDRIAAAFGITPAAAADLADQIPPIGAPGSWQSGQPQIWGSQINPLENQLGLYDIGRNIPPDLPADTEPGAPQIWGPGQGPLGPTIPAGPQTSVDRQLAQASILSEMARSAWDAYQNFPPNVGQWLTAPPPSVISPVPTTPSLPPTNAPLNLAPLNPSLPEGYTITAPEPQELPQIWAPGQGPLGPTIPAPQGDLGNIIQTLLGITPAAAAETQPGGQQFQLQPGVADTSQLFGGNVNNARDLGPFLGGPPPLSGGIDPNLSAPFADRFPTPTISPSTVAGAQAQVPPAAQFPAPEESPADRVAGSFGPFAPGPEYVPPTFPATVTPPAETRDERNARLTQEIAGQFGRTAPTDQEQFANRTAKNDYAPTVSPNTGFPQLELKPAESGPASPVNRDITTMDLPVLDAERQQAIRGGPYAGDFIPSDPYSTFSPSYPTLPSPQEAYRGIDPRLASPTAPAETIPSVLDQMGRTIPPIESAPLWGLGMPWGQGRPFMPDFPMPQTVDRTGKGDLQLAPPPYQAGERGDLFGPYDYMQTVDRTNKGDFQPPAPGAVLDQMGRTIAPIATSTLPPLGPPWGLGQSPYMPDQGRGKSDFERQFVDRTGKGDLEIAPATQPPSVLDQMGRTIPPIETSPLAPLGMPWGQGRPFMPEFPPEQQVDRTGKTDLDQFANRVAKGDFLGRPDQIPLPTARPDFVPTGPPGRGPIPPDAPPLMQPTAPPVPPTPPPQVQQPPWPPELPPPPPTTTTAPPAAPAARPSDEQVRQTVTAAQGPIQTPSGLQISLPQLASMFANPSYFWEAQATAQELMRRAQLGDPVALMQLQMLNQMTR